jgi:DNA-binding MarR family transcriptional regulator
LPGKKRSAVSSKELTAPLARMNPFEQLKALLVRKKLRQRLNLTEDHIRSVLLVRRARGASLGEQLFSDPAWDILLELFAAKLGEREMSLADVARAIETPESTTKRWVAALEERGLVQSRIDVAKANVVWIRLTEQGADRLGDLTDHWGSAFVSI